MNAHVIESVSKALHFAREQFAVGDKRLKVIIGVSGGADSVVLLDVVCRLRDELALTPIVAHVDHGLRPESKDEAQFVAELCQKYAVPFEQLAAPAREAGENLEAWGRRIRYEFLIDLF